MDSPPAEKDRHSRDAYRALARRLAHMDPARFDRRTMSAHAIVRKLRPKLLAAIVQSKGQTDIHDVHSMLRDQGIHLSLETLRRYLRAGTLAEPKIPATLRRRPWNQALYEAKVRDVCRALPQGEVPPVVWAEYQRLLERDAR